MGVIRNFKGHYRVKLSSRLISELDLDSSHQMKDLLKNVNLLDAIHLLSEAWDDVKKETVANCFKHAKFTKTEETLESIDVFGDVDLPENMTEDDLLAQVEQDKDLEVAGTYTDEELVEEARRKRQNTDLTANDDDDENADDEIEEDILSADVIAALKVVRKFSQKNNLNQEIVSLRSIEKKVMLQKANNSKQTTIKSFFTCSK